MSQKRSKHGRDLDKVFSEIERLGLQQQIAEIDARGYTVIERLMPDDQLETARQVIADLCEKQTGTKVNFETGEGHEDYRLIPWLLGRHPVFIDIMLNEKTLAVVRYLTGMSSQISTMACHFKGPGPGGELTLHSDTLLPPPFPPYSVISNCNYALVDYTKEAGALATVPGSHRLSRHPRAFETRLVGPDANPDAIPVECPAGSVVIWHGNQWHGSYPRTIPGLRLNLACVYTRPIIKPQELYGTHLPQSLRDEYKDNADFRQLVGLNDTYGWTAEGPSYSDPLDGSRTQIDTVAYSSGNWHA